VIELQVQSTPKDIVPKAMFGFVTTHINMWLWNL